MQVAAAVFVNGASDRQVLTLWTTNDASATGAALRHLRKIEAAAGSTAQEDKAWRLGRMPARQLASLPDWRLRPPRVERLIQELGEAIPTTVADLFKVQQGIRTGLNDAFLLAREQWLALPPAEQGYFRKAVTNASIRDGRLETNEYVFYPYKRGRPAFATETELAAAVPTYFARHLEPRQPPLLLGVRGEAG